MPADLPISKDENRSLDDEMARWLTEFQVRPGKFDHFDAEDALNIADYFFDDRERMTEEFLDEVNNRVEEVRGTEITMDRYPVLHVSRQNLGEIEERSELPEGFFNEFTEVVADYIDGFMPNQSITPPRRSIFVYEKNSDSAGSYSFRKDRSRVLSASGNPDSGSPAAEVSAHETMHKNNVDAILDDPATMRSFAHIYNKQTPQDYQSIVNNSNTARVNGDLLGALSLFYMDMVYQTGILASYSSHKPSEVEFESYTEEFEEAVEAMEEKHELAYFDIRDEAICQSVSYFIKGSFENDFEKALDNTREHYNESSKYSERAGDAIGSHLRHIRGELARADGLRGQRFKQVMQKRIPFLKNEESFHKYGKK